MSTTTSPSTTPGWPDWPGRIWAWARERGEPGRWGGVSELPDWWQPLLTRVSGARQDDFTRLAVPPEGGRPSAVLILLADGDHGGPDVLLLERAADMRNHAGQPAFPGGAADPGDPVWVRHPSGWIGPAFRVRSMLVWGFTAGVLSVLLELGGWSVPWEDAPQLDFPIAGDRPVP